MTWVRMSSQLKLATAEFAVVLPLVVGLLIWVVSTVALGVDQIRCVDAARLAARSLARSDADEVAVGLARSAAPAGATITVSGSSDRVTVTVASRRTIAGLAGWTVSSTATAAREVVRAGAWAGPAEDTKPGRASPPGAVLAAPARVRCDV